MKYLSVITILALLLSCKPKQEAKLERYYIIFKTRNCPDSTYSSLARYIERHDPDTLKKKEARAWLEEQQQKADNKIILARAFELIDVFKVQEECNYFRKHYLAVKLTSNEDTLRKATVLLAHSLYDQVPETCERYWGRSAGVFLYETEDDFKRQRSFAMATTEENRFTEVRVGNDQPVVLK